MNIGGTGSREIPDELDATDAAYELFSQAQLDFSSTDSFQLVIGGCKGGDCVLATLARTCGWNVHTILPADTRQLCEHWQAWHTSGGYLPHSTTYERMPDGTSFLDRDQKVVDQSQVLVALPLHEEHLQPRSGTWATIRMAQRKNIRVLRRVLEPLTNGKEAG